MYGSCECSYVYVQEFKLLGTVPKAGDSGVEEGGGRMTGNGALFRLAKAKNSLQLLRLGSTQ